MDAFEYFSTELKDKTHLIVVGDRISLHLTEEQAVAIIETIMDELGITLVPSAGSN